MKVSLPPYVRLTQTKGFAERKRMAPRYEIHTSYDSKFRCKISGELGNLLIGLNGEETVGELLRHSAAGREREQGLMAELKELWSKRLVTMHA
jgi:hypothetical protein